MEPEWWACSHPAPGRVRTIDLRVAFSALAEASARRSASRWLLGLCALGFLASLVALAGLGYGLDRWVFVLLVWVALVFLPLRIVLEASQTLAAGTQRAVAARIVADPARYDRAAALPVIVRALAVQAALPRICKPQHRRSAIEAAIAIITRANARPAPQVVLRAVIGRLVAAAAREASALSAAVAGAAAVDIQARWERARALGALGGLAALLGAVYADRWGDPPSVEELDGRGLAEYLGAVMDYCDEAALKVDALPWTEPPVTVGPDAAAIGAIRATWSAFLAAGWPAPRALAAFVDAVLPGPEPA
ncbi:MAG: hypothetical protein QN120_10430 [Armatimonadota bacterium]|nr:hypothetical protein [Armatimonadota bacterium]